jgi:hypothetical protein
MQRRNVPPTAWGPRHDTGASSSRLLRPWDASLGGEPGQQHGVGEADLAPEVHDRELSGAQEPGACLRAHAQPPVPTKNSIRPISQTVMSFAHQPHAQ